jgi:outer membrane protein OmpA-like peptidoglycan-associated protein
MSAGKTALCLLIAAPALAQDRPLTVQLFVPALDSKGYFTQNASQVLRPGETSFGLVASWAKNPLELHAGHPACPPDDPSCRSFVVENLVTMQAQAAVGLLGRYELSLSVPGSIWSGDADPSPARDDAGRIDGQGLGDIALSGKARIFATSTHPFGLAVVATANLPTGSRERFLGEAQPVLAPGVIVDKDLLADRLHVALNVGARLRAESRTFRDDAVTRPAPGGGVDVSPRACPDPQDPALPCGTGEQVQNSRAQATYGVGASYAVAYRRFDVVAEAYGTADPAADSDTSMFPVEALAGVKVYVARNSYFGLGGGAGLNEAWGSPDARVFGMFVYEPSIGDRDGDGLKDDVDRCVDDPEDLDSFDDTDGCPEPDNDRDGTLDREDRCPNEPEDKDGQDDSDGCPEADLLDRDGDGLLDDDDGCPDDPEDFDRPPFKDEDGCPDPDNDEDRILDIADACPDDPEDHDRFEDEDGCPDPDNDRDRILDVVDKCPNEPEVYNGFEDVDGCPDRGRVIVRRGAIEILDKIYFETNKAIIKEISFGLLDAIAATIQGNPQILAIEIQGHADERAPDDYNLRLTDERAHSVLRYLVDKGVAPSRISAKGYGETRPVCKEHNEPCWTQNRRVEFVILKRAEEGMR